MTTFIPVTFRQADGLRFHLENRFLNQREQFPHGATDYVNSFKQIEDHLNEKVHPNTVLGAAVNGDGLLNDHGVDHVKMVIHRAGLLLRGIESHLTGYEIFILLIAIHFHDVGNTQGRKGHEAKIFEIMEDEGVAIPLENEEKQMISQIAMVHGGEREDGDKDTIISLNPDEAIQGMSVRPRVIAAILRFADEIADEASRANRYFVGEKIPETSRAYHEFSQALQPAHIKGTTLQLHFQLREEMATGPTSKGQQAGEGPVEQIYLYDEILKRLKKCLCELEYCSKYSTGMIRVSTISVRISVRRQKALQDIYSDAFKLEVSGYPHKNDMTVKELAKPNLKAKDGDALVAQLTGGN
jgi:hypothetical protein